MVLFEGLFQFSVTLPLPTVAARPVGAAGFGGGAVGVAVAVAEASLLPPSFTARISKAYWVPLLSPVTVWLVVVLLLARSAQVALAGTLDPAP